MPDSATGLPVPSKPPGTPGQKALALGSRYGLRLVALGYLAVILAAPLALVFWNAFDDGFGAAWDAITTPAALHALKLTLIITAIAVPLNAVFGVVAALILVRRRVPGKPLISALIDLPLALSPVVVGLALILVWGNTGWFGPTADDLGVQVIFAVPGMVLATIFICLPSWCARSSRCSARSAPSRRRPPPPSARARSRPSGASRCRRSAGG